MKKENLKSSDLTKSSSKDFSGSKKRSHGKSKAVSESSTAVPTPQEPSIDSSFKLFMADFKASNSK